MAGRSARLRSCSPRLRSGDPPCSGDAGVPTRARRSSAANKRALAQPLFEVAVVWLWWDELDRAKEAFEWLIGRAREMGDEGSLPYTLVLAAQVECVRGDLALAARHADEGFEITEQAGQATLERVCAGPCAPSPTPKRATAEPPGLRPARALALASRTSGSPAEHFATAPPSASP